MKKIILAIILIMNTQAILAGNEKGNGGDAVVCNGKIVTLDSVLMSDTNYFDIKRGSNYIDSINNIKNHFDSTLPLMGQALASFISTFNSKGSFGSGVIWVKGKVKDVADENLFVDLPAHCEKDVLQTIVLVKKPTKRYFYDASIVEELEKNDDELSWLLIHEWLRDYLDDSDVIRVLNAYLHSEQFLSSSEIEVKEGLKLLGISDWTGPMKSEENLANKMMKIKIPQLSIRLSELRGNIAKLSELKGKKEKKEFLRSMFEEARNVQKELYNLFMEENNIIDKTLSESLAKIYDEKKRVDSELEGLSAKLSME